MKRVHTEGYQFGPCSICGGTGDHTPAGEWGGGWTGESTHAMCWNRRRRARQEAGPDAVALDDESIQPGLGL